MLAQQDEDVVKVIIPRTELELEQLSVKEYRDRKQVMAQYGS